MRTECDVIKKQGTWLSVILIGHPKNPWLVLAGISPTHDIQENDICMIFNRMERGITGYQPDPPAVLVQVHDGSC